MQVSEIIREVRLNIDEGRSNDSQMVSTLAMPDAENDVDLATDAEDLDEIIKANIERALRYVYTTADESVLDPIFYSGPAVCQIEGGYSHGVIDATGAFTGAGEGIVTGPVSVSINSDNFLRFVSAKLSSWLRAVDEPIYDTDKEYAMQWNPLVCGSPERPVVAITPRVGKTVKIELFRPKTLGESVIIKYLGVPEVKNGAVDVGVHVKDAFIYYLTALVMTVLHDNKANDMAQLAHSYMGRGDAMSQTPPQPQQPQ